MPKTKKIEYLDAWAVIPKDTKQLEFSYCECEDDFGGWRYPIFRTRKEAQAYKKAVSKYWRGIAKRIYLRVEYN